ncbi:MAG: murein L,D-transpeptidase catalytic domain family protein [Bacteroidales bacterium]|nr:murein L,D-transpeptidase catalytic domain family protein [Bacteroidales bacterium]MBK7627133.1 murein L,D-transpeptidase catalytic domain family protein [Bacteroidales bacterium]
MNILRRIIILTLSTLCLNFSYCKQTVKENEIQKLWADCKLEGEVPPDVFSSAIIGYRKIENNKKKNILTIIDYSKPSDKDRFFVIDLDTKKLLFKCLVAHGKNSGEYIATSFSNQSGSLKSSLGFFLTAETYYGDNGYSLRLDGLEKGINDSARMRDIVIHGAGYVSQNFIAENGRLGRSWGCPALPLGLTKEIIDCISEGSCLFIYAADSLYSESSVLCRPDRKR